MLFGQQKSRAGGGTISFGGQFYLGVFKCFCFNWPLKEGVRHTNGPNQANISQHKYQCGVGAWWDPGKGFLQRYSGVAPFLCPPGGQQHDLKMGFHLCWGALEVRRFQHQIGLGFIRGALLGVGRVGVASGLRPHFGH